MEVKRKSKYDISGERFGKLTVVQFDSYASGQKTRWLCKCDCGGTKIVRNDSLKQGHTKSCGCELNRTGSGSRGWKGFEGISQSRFYKIQFDAKKRGHTVEVSLESLWKLFLAQDKKCALTGLPLEFGASKKDPAANASLDRIDSSLGYIEGNVQWVDKRVNFMKQGYSQQEFIQICKLIASKHA